MGDGHHEVLVGAGGEQAEAEQGSGGEIEGGEVDLAGEGGEAVDVGHPPAGLGGVEGSRLAAGRHRHELQRDLRLALGVVDRHDGALEGPLERHGRPRVRTVVADQIIELITQESLNRFRQLIDIDVAGPQHFLRVRVFEQGKQKVLQRAELVVQFSGGGQGPAEGFFKL